MQSAKNIFEISKLIFELTAVGSRDNDFDALLEQLFTVLHKLPTLGILSKGAIIMFNRRRQPVRVAQYGLEPVWLIDHNNDELNGFDYPYNGRAVVAHLPRSPESDANPAEPARLLLLPLHTAESPLGQILLFIAPAWSPTSEELEFLTDLSHALSGIINRFLLNATLHVREVELEDARTEAIRRLGTASEYRDNETGMHIMRMTNIAGAVAKAMGLSDELRELLFITAPMHDVGKIGIADAILLKPDKLTPDEFETMKSHT
jgi:HD-GYP domain-containing protein (c-di-GMP phosphodiesterase class II)